MDKKLSLKEAERRAWTLYYEDGLWEIFLGLLFLGGGLRSLTDSVWFYLFVLAGIIAFILGRRMITLPRVGVIKFGPRREKRRKVLLAVIIAAVTLTLLLLLLPALGIAAPGRIAGLIMAFTVPLIFIYMAYLLEFRRLYGYALLVGLFMLVTELISVRAGAWVQLVAGLIILLIGLWHLREFLKAYPIPDDTEMAVGGSDDGS